MKLPLILLLILSCFSLWAETMPPTRIHDLKQDKAFKEALVFMENGRVLKAAFENKELLRTLQEAHLAQSFLIIEHNEKRQIEDARIYPHMEVPESVLTEEIPWRKQNFTPTILSSYNEAKKIFRAQRGGSLGSSECYHRAHVWSWEAFKNSGINSMKIFMFFTQKFIRENDYEWWFHVSPMVYAKENGGVVEYIMDKRFLSGPSYLSTWTRIFVKGASCPEISKYSQYSQNQEKESCYLMKFIMHYYQPKDLEALERLNAVKNFWFDWEIKEAYQLGYGVKK